MCWSRAHVPCFGGTWAVAHCTCCLCRVGGSSQGLRLLSHSPKGKCKVCLCAQYQSASVCELEDSCLVRKVRGTAFRSLRLPCRRFHSISAASSWLVSHAMHGEEGRLHCPVWPGGLPLPSLSGGKPYTMWPSLPREPGALGVPEPALWRGCQSLRTLASGGWGLVCIVCLFGV